MKLTAFAALLLLPGCLFQSGGTDVPDDGSTRDAGADASPGADASTPADAASPGDDMAPIDGDPDVGPDMADEPFRFRALGTHRVVVPMRPSFLGEAPLEVPDSEDSNIQAHLRVAWSATVDWVGATTLPDGGVDLALLGTHAYATANCTGSCLAEAWQNPPFPTWVLSRSTFNDAHLWQGDAVDVPNPEIQVTNPLSELAMQLPSRFKVYDDDTLNVSTRTEPGRGETPFMFTLPDASQGPPVLGVEVGTMLTNGAPAGGRRIATGADEADGFNWWGWVLADNSVAWLLQNPLPLNPVAPCVLLTGATMTAAEFHLASRMRRNGCDVTFATTPPRRDAGIVVVSPSAPAPAVGQLVSHPAPVILLFQSAATLDALQLTRGAQTGSDNGTSWVLRDEPAAGLRADRSGLVKVQAHGPIFSVAAATVTPAANRIAARQGDVDAVTYFVVESGEPLADSEAVGDRAALSIGPHLLTEASPDGMSFFDAALQWAMWRSGR